MSFGCEEDSVTVYTVDKPEATQQETPPATSTPTATPDGNVTWQLPATWKKSDQQKPMRIATYFVELEGASAEVSFTKFPGDVGGQLANLNRWRRQIGLPPVANTDEVTSLQEIESGVLAGYFVHMVGDASSVLAAGIYDPRKDETWFVKAMLPPALAVKLQPSFLQVVQSFAVDSDSGEG